MRPLNTPYCRADDFKFENDSTTTKVSVHTFEIRGLKANLTGNLHAYLLAEIDNFIEAVTEVPAT